MSLRPGEPFDRYRVEALLGAGGMGQVYRAVDDRLRRPVALKVISTAVGLASGMSSRVLREARAAAAIDHPNAIAIYDVGEHDGVPFLAMELVDGSTLRRLIGDATVPVAQRMHWMLAVARALGAAHRRNIVHRDIKPENVMVRVDGLVKVLDFGIARPMTPSERPVDGAATGALVPRTDAMTSPLSVLTDDSGAVGTPLYMSPEQLRGESIDGRSDQFSWGVVAWELLAGTLPWPVERGGPAVVSAILSLELPALRSIVPAVPAEMAAVVERALRKKANDRFGTTDDLVAALEKALGLDAFEAVASARPSVSPIAHTVEAPEHASVGTKRRRRRMAAAGLVAAVALGTGAVTWRAHAERTAAEARLALIAQGRRPVVAVLGPDAVAELLATELASSGELRVVPRDVTTRAVGTAGGGTPAGVPGESLAKLRAVANADYAVLAEKEPRAGGASRIVARVVGIPASGAAGDAVAVSADGREDDLAALVARAGAEVRRVLGRPALDPEQAAALRAAMPRTSAAAQAYAEGMACRARYDYAGANRAFQRAVDAEGDFALAHLELSRAYTATGYDARALDEAARALELSPSLGREQRLVIEAQHAVAAKDWHAASDRYHTLFGFFPDNLDYGLAYARTQVLGGDRPEAFATLDRLRSAPRSAIDEARLDLLETFVASKTADVKRSLAASTRAKAEADALGAEGIAADARTSRAEALMLLGRGEEGRQDLEEARMLVERLGDRSALAGIYRQEARLAENASDYEGALPLLERAIAMAREVGDQYRLGGVLTTKAIVLAELGRFARAEAGFDEARVLYESIQDLEGTAHNTGNAAEMRVARGVVAGARDAFARALAIHQRIHMMAGVAEQTLNVGWASYLEGDSQGAGPRIAEAVTIAGSISDTEDWIDARMRQGDWLRARDDIAGAPAAYDEAARKMPEDGHLDTRAQIDLARARLRLDAGNAAGAATLARSAIDRLVAAKVPHLEALARAVLVRALVASGALDDAARERESLEALLPSCELFEARFEARLAASDLAAAHHDRAGALRAIDEARSMAEAGGLVPWVFEARLSGARLSSPSERAALAKDARAAGFLRVARLASKR